MTGLRWGPPLAIRRPVRREGAERYLLITLVSFAATVIVTRWFLAITGFPQIGGGDLHIAHALWGGVALFAAALLPILLAGRMVYMLSALLAGVGIGLFIDEVGKFITATNDYFFPAAAPIVYAFFLLTVLVYLRVRRPKDLDARAELYAALDGMEEMLDGELSREERTELIERLRRAEAKATETELARLARALRGFVARSRRPRPVESEGMWAGGMRVLLDWERRFLPRGRYQAALVGGLAGLALLALKDPGETLFGASLPGLFGAFTGRRLGLEAAPRLFALRISLELAIGLVLILAATLVLVGREKTGLAVGTLALLLSLTVMNLVVMYFEQFSTIVMAAVQLVVLLGIFRFRARFPG
ncbi:MAG: hypothetical protein ACRDG5_03670 [Anaerolineales bacterium]